MTDKQPALFDWATELSDAQGHVTLSEQEAHEIGARLRRLHSENETLQQGYAAARMEIESLQARIKTMAEEHADELMVAHLDGRMRAARPAGSANTRAQENVALLADILNRRPAMNAGLTQAYAAWTAEVYDLMGAIAAEPANEDSARAAPQTSPASQGDALDAERYRWLREPRLAAGQGSITVELDDRANGRFSRSIFLAELDAAIDAARAAQEGK